MFRSRSLEGQIGGLIAELASRNVRKRIGALSALQSLAESAASPYDAGCAAGDPEAERLWDLAHRSVLERPEVRAALLRALEDPEEEVRGLVTLLLWHVGGNDAGGALIRHLETDPSAAVRRMCVVALRFKEEDYATEALVRALAQPDRDVVMAAATALGEREDPRAVEPLRGQLSHPDWNVRFSAAQALVELDAVDPGLLALLENLVAAPEAQDHDRGVMEANQIAEQFGGGAGALRTGEVLEQARNALESMRTQSVPVNPSR